MSKIVKFGSLIALLLFVLACSALPQPAAPTATVVPATLTPTLTPSVTATKTATFVPTVTLTPTLGPLVCEKERLQVALDEAILKASGLEGQLTPPATPALSVTVVYAAPIQRGTDHTCSAVFVINSDEMRKGSQWTNGWEPALRAVFLPLSKEGKKAVFAFAYGIDCIKPNVYGCHFWQQENLPANKVLKAIAVNVPSGSEEKLLVGNPLPTATPTLSPLVEYDETLCNPTAIQEDIDQELGAGKFTITTAMPLETGCQIAGTVVNPVEWSTWDGEGWDAKVRELVPGGVDKFFYILGNQGEWHGNTQWINHNENLIGFVVNAPSQELSQLYVTRRGVLLTQTPEITATP